MQKDRQDVEALLREGKTIQVKPKGSSMYPLFVPDRDEAVIKKVDPAGVKRGDVLLYRRGEGILVLHRLYRKRADGLYLIGDHQTEVEGPVPECQVRGILTAFIRGGRYVKVTNPVYRLLAGVWLLLRPVRHELLTAGAAVKKFIRRIFR